MRTNVLFLFIIIVYFPVNVNQKFILLSSIRITLPACPAENNELMVWENTAKCRKGKKGGLPSGFTIT